MPDKFCDACLHFDLDRDEGATYGKCRRHAPAPFTVADGDTEHRLAIWPIVSSSDRCGQFEQDPDYWQTNMPEVEVSEPPWKQWGND